MASSNVDLVRSIYAARQRGDFSSNDWAHPEIEFVMADGPIPGRWQGLAGLAEVMRDWIDAWQEFRGEAEEYRELDNERVLVLVHMKGRGKTSGLELEHLGAKAATLYQIREGKVIKVVQYLDGQRALADLGLASDGG